MSKASLDILENRIKTAVQETKDLRAENERLQASLKQVTAERDILKKQADRWNAGEMVSNPGLDIAAMRERLQALLGRLERLEQDLCSKEK